LTPWKQYDVLRGYVHRKIMKILSHSDIAYLKKKAHHLKAVVQIGKLGLTDALAAAADEALEAHELIKVKFVGCKEERHEIAAACAERTGGALVGIIGNVAIMYRPRKDPAKRTIKLPEAGWT